MMHSQPRMLWRSAVSLMAVFALTTQVGQGLALAAGTAPATVISNTATATYSDGNGNTYTTNSNTVTTTVQNAPSVSVTPPTPQSVAPGQVVVDTYTLTNTGNASANFTLPAAATVGASGALAGYVIAGTTCTAAAPCTLANANTALAALPVTVAGGTLAVGIEYTVSPTATAGSTIPTVLSAATVQPAASQTVGGVTTTVPSATSATTTGTVTDTVAPQARLDLNKSISTPTSATAPLTFTILANNGGGFAATDLTSVKTLLGSPAAGVLITDVIPAFGGTPLTLSGTPTATLPGGNTGSAATIYYSTSATGAAGSWSTTYAAGDFYIGVLVSGGTGGVELPSKPTGSSGAGVVTTPEVTLTFATVQPTGTGAANAGAITDVADSVIGGNPGATGVTPIIGPNIPAGTADSPTPTTPLTNAIDNTTPVTPNGSTTPPGGASNQASASAYSSAMVLNGPADAPGATGSYPAAPNNGGAAASNQNDFTAVSFVCVGGVSVTGTTCKIPTAGITVPGSYTNSGNNTDTLGVSVVVPIGFIATIYNATCPAAIPANSNITTVCTPTGAAIGTGSSTTTATGIATGSFGSVPSNTTPGAVSGNYVVVYTPLTPGTSAAPNGTPIDSAITVSGTGGSAQDSNTTHADLFPGGPVTLTKSAGVVSGCTGTGQAAGGVCPGGTITYTIAYANVAPLGSTATNPGTEPAYALGGLVTSSVVITEDGTGANANTTGNNWATFSNGLTGAPVVTNTVGSTAFTFVYSPTAGTAAGSTKFTATATTIAAGSTGTLAFSVVIK